MMFIMHWIIQKYRIFAYDFQGNMLYAFGGHGYKAGLFMNPSAIEDLGDSLLVTDQKLGTITQFTLTDYGKMINDGLAEYKKGNYDESANIWRKVLKHNGNYDQAYIEFSVHFFVRRTIKRQWITLN